MQCRWPHCIYKCTFFYIHISDSLCISWRFSAQNQEASRLCVSGEAPAATRHPVAKLQSKDVCGPAALWPKLEGMTWHIDTFAKANLFSRSNRLKAGTYRVREDLISLRVQPCLPEMFKVPMKRKLFFCPSNRWFGGARVKIVDFSKKLSFLL